MKKGVLSGRVLALVMFFTALCAGFASPSLALATSFRPPALDKPRLGLSLARADDGTLYAIGGLTPDSVRPTRIDASLDGASWRPMPAQATGRWFAGTAMLDGELYVVGGSDRTFSSRAVTSYDPRTELWTARSPMHDTRFGHGTAVVGGLLYAIGGQAEGPNATWSRSSVERYDPKSDRWTYRADLPDEVAFAGVAAAKGRIYVAGGTLVWGGVRQPLSTLYIYEPTTDRWHVGAPMPTPRSHLSLVAATNGRLYAIGGNTGTGAVPKPSAVVEEYDPITDRWRAFNPMAAPRIGAAALDDGGAILVAGGFDLSRGVQRVLGSTELLPYPPPLPGGPRATR